MRRYSIICLLLVLLSGCSYFGAAFQQIRDVGNSPQEKYAQARYEIALRYMEVGRFELARQQFAVAAISATKKELRQRAIAGYQNASRVIFAQR